MGDAGFIHEIEMSQLSYQCDRCTLVWESSAGSRNGRCSRLGETSSRRSDSTHLRGDRYARHDSGAVSRAGGKMKLSSDQVDPLAHADQAESCCKFCGLEVETYAVVRDLQAELLIRPVQLHDNA